MECLCGKILKTEDRYLTHIFTCAKIDENLQRVLSKNFQWLTERGISMLDVQHIIRDYKSGIYFSETDEINRKAKIEGKVPVNCMLKGESLEIYIKEKEDPCKFCLYDREICGGRPFEIQAIVKN